jgi:epoxide hydrolase-like predicted phosphatase
MSNKLNTNIRAVIFDIGGVMIRTEDKRPRTMLADAFAMTFEQLENLVFNGERGHAAQRGEISAEENWEQIRKELDLRPDELTPVRDTFFAGDVLDRDLITFIRSLRSDFTTAIITNAFDDVREALTTKFKIADAFDHIVVSAEEGMMKPDPRIYQKALSLCGVEPGEAVFIDDFPHNIQAAQKLGMQAIWFREREQALQALKNLLGK